MKDVPSGKEEGVGCWEDICEKLFPKGKRSWDSLGRANLTTGSPAMPLCFWQCLSPASHAHNSSGPCFSQWPVRTWKTAVPALRKGVNFVRLQGEPWFRCVRATCLSLAELALFGACVYIVCCIAVGLGLIHRDEPSLSLRPESVNPVGWNLSFLPSLVPSHGPSCYLKENTLALLDGFADHIFFFFCHRQWAEMSVALCGVTF